MPRTRLANLGRVAEHNLYDLRQVFPTTGNIFFVDSGASAGGNGLSPEAAVLTIDAAIGLCTANNGDIIVVMEGHAESVVGAAGIAADVAGITIVGLGRGRKRPVITFTTATAASCDISAASIHVENLVFVNGIDAQTAMINISAADVTIKGCEIQTGDATTQAVLGILTTDVARIRIEGCHIHGLVTAGTTSQISIVGGDSHVIKDNFLFGACATTGNIAAATTASLNGLIIGNVILNQTADGNNKAIVLGASDTYMIVNNRMAVIDSTGPAPVTAAAAYVSGNYWTGAAGVTASTLM
jgi:hypothetical protein